MKSAHGVTSASGSRRLDRRATQLRSAAAIVAETARGAVRGCEGMLRTLAREVISAGGADLEAATRASEALRVQIGPLVEARCGAAGGMLAEVRQGLGR